mgnify:CR=1 FL=1
MAADQPASGLKFVSHDRLPDERTGLNITANQPFFPKGDFCISFDFRFEEGHIVYFGYIFRIINGQTNFDFLLYDDTKVLNTHLGLVAGNTERPVVIDMPQADYFGQWVTMTARFDFSRQEVVCTLNDRQYVMKLPLRRDEPFQLLFGAHHHDQFSSNDVPPMTLRNIQLYNADRVLGHWPLDEDVGRTAHDKKAGNHGSVRNPVWTRAEHTRWKPLLSLKSSPATSVAFDGNTDRLFIVGTDSLIIVDVATGTPEVITYRTPRGTPKVGNQSLYIAQQRTLYNIYPDDRLLTAFDFTDRSWSDVFRNADSITAYWHFNKFYNPADSSIYLLNGYGYRTYKNTVFRVHTRSGKWEKVTPKNAHTPRYLAGLGSLGDSAYFIGGYGSETGNQLVNPKNLYDFICYHTSDFSTRRVYSLAPGERGFAFANSLVIDGKDRFFGLVFPNNQYEGSLRLVSGSLNKPGLTFLADSIPYKFLDIRSFADLFYAQHAQQLVAVTILENEEEATVSVYTLKTPPAERSAPPNAARGLSPMLWWCAAGAILLVVSWLMWRRFKSRKERPDTQVARPVSNAIFLFGEFQLFDREGNEIVQRMPPLLKEFLLLALVHSTRHQAGISSRLLYETLWPDKPTSSARNNKAVNVAKLKNLLESVPSIRLVSEHSMLQVIFDPEIIYFDYKKLLDVLHAAPEKAGPDLETLIPILSRGPFLPHLDYPWLDQIKAEVANEVIDLLSHQLKTGKLSKDPETQIRFANCIFHLDPANEDAMRLKCRALAALGKHSLAKQTFDDFAHRYEQIYGEAFPLRFTDAMKDF